MALEQVDRVDPDSAQVEVTGTAYVAASAPWGPLPDDIDSSTAVELYDVYGAGLFRFTASRTAALQFSSRCHRSATWTASGAPRRPPSA